MDATGDAAILTNLQPGVERCGTGTGSSEFRQDIAVVEAAAGIDEAEATANGQAGHYSGTNQLPAGQGHAQRPRE